VILLQTIGGIFSQLRLPVIAVLVACAAEFVIEAAKSGVFACIVVGTPKSCSARSSSPSVCARMSRS
jgi:hypothetical protein